MLINADVVDSVFERKINNIVDIVVEIVVVVTSSVHCPAVEDGGVRRGEVQ